MSMPIKDENSLTHDRLFDILISKMRKYHPSDDFTRVEKAYLLARQAHGDQLRKSGEPYIIHPLSVACILSEMELDTETIIAGILHDVIEDTNYTRNDISQTFSDEVALLVDGVTKLDKIGYTSLEEVQAENYRKMFLAMAEDIRVILIKVADRLHNLRTLKYMPPDKQKKTAQETLDIYAPIAHRLGISKLRYEMEDLSFRYLNPDAYYDLKDKIQYKQSEREEYVRQIVQELKARFIAEGVDCQVEGRPKHFFSIYKKMVKKNIDLEQVYDLFAVRILVESIRDCYTVLGIVNVMYHSMPGRFKDYISTPKSNMYQSIHNTLIGPEGEPFEVQIRTFDMHRTADYGIAAHWKYKTGKGGFTSYDKEEEKLVWLRQILEWQREFSDNKEYLDILKFDLNVYKDHIYCFTPKGKVVSLITGSTPIDFAYAIHSGVGNMMTGAKVNGEIVNIDYRLSNGDRVEILTNPNSRGPSQDWLKIVKSSQARSKINQWFRNEYREDNIVRGRDLLEKGAKKRGITLSELLTADRMRIILNKFHFIDWDSLCAAVGHGGLRELQVINRLYDEYSRDINKDIDRDELVRQLINQETSEDDDIRGRKGGSGSIIVKGIGDLEVRFSKCCSPVPGDEIIGFITRGRGLSIHRADCVNIVNLDILERHRLISANWHPTTDRPFRADIKVIGDDRIGILADVAKILADHRIDVKWLNTRTTKTTAILSVAIIIKSKDELTLTMQRLLNVRGVHEVERITI